MFGQGSDIKKILSEVDLVSKYEEMVSEMNCSGGYMRESKTEIGSFDSIMLGDDDAQFKFRLSVSVHLDWDTESFASNDVEPKTEE